MLDCRLIERYRGFDIIVEDVRSGPCRGVARQGKRILADLQGDGGAQALMALLRVQVDEAIEAAAAERGEAVPDPQQFAQAFRVIGTELNEAHRKMLRALWRAPERTATTGALAKAAGLPDPSAAHLQFGLLGQKVWDVVPFELPRRDDGTRIYACAIATSVPGGAADVGRWRWSMRPEVAEAVGTLGLHK